MDVLQAIADRRSHRVYKPEQIPEEVLEKILKAGLEAPSAMNRQEWHFSLVQDAGLLQEIHDAAAEVMAKGKGPGPAREGFQIFYHAPAAVFLFGQKDFDWTQVDCGIAVQNMALAAESLGVGSVILGLPKLAFAGDKAEALKKRLECPEGYEFVIALALGYATDTKDSHGLREEKISRIR